MSELKDKRCIPCEGGAHPLPLQQTQELLKKLNQWEIIENNSAIQKKYKFKNYYHTLAFVNAVAWIAHQENHHPDLQVSYNSCQVTYTTHAIKGLSENDFICAAKVDELGQD